MIHLDSESIDRCMESVHEAILLDPEIRAQLEASRPDFFPGELDPRATQDERRRSARRHVEWFLIERPIGEHERERLEALIEFCARETAVDPEEWRLALERSHAGLFEVLADGPGPGKTLRDLAGGFGCTLVEGGTSSGFEAGDLVAGRVFPVGDGRFHMSPAAARFRSARLLVAIRADIDRARTDRPPATRGSPRLRSVEIEAILQGLSGKPLGNAGGRLAAIARAREMFEENGLSAEDTDELLEWLAREAPDPTRILPGGGDVLGDVLDALAFETDVDLDAARTVLIEAWDQLHSADPGPAAAAPPDPDPIRKPRDVAEAIAEFDRKRREGAPLDRALNDLERDLDLDLDDSELGDDLDEAGDSAPDLPGVVGGVVEEFLWDEGRVHGEERARRYGALRGLGRAAEAVVVFENLGRRELVDFACRWVIEEGELRDPEDAEALLEGLDRFCRWVEENHDVPLHTDFAPVLSGLRRSLPRVALANRAASRAPGSRPSGTEWLELVERRGMELATFADRSGRQVEIEVDGSILEHMQPGDWIRGQGSAPKQLLVEACYPAELSQVLGS